jgi:hypothetical protein
MSDRKFVDIRVEGSESELIEFLKLCSVIEYLGQVGASRTIRLGVDGDGSARLKFVVVEGKERRSIPNIGKNIDLDEDEISLGIGG